MRQEHKRVTLARRIALHSEEGLEELWCVRNEGLVFAVDGVDGKDGVFADVGVTVLEAGATDWDERLEEFDVLGDLLQESKGCTANVLVGVLLW